MMVAFGRLSAEEHPRWQSTGFNSGLFGGQNYLAQLTAHSHGDSFCASGGVRGSTVLLQ